MDITTNLDGNTGAIAVKGKLTVATSPELEDAVRQLGTGAVNFDIDLSELEYISSAGLRVLVSTQKLAMQRGGSIRLLHPIAEVTEVFEMTGLSEVMTIVS